MGNYTREEMSAYYSSCGMVNYVYIYILNTWVILSLSLQWVLLALVGLSVLSCLYFLVFFALSVCWYVCILSLLQCVFVSLSVCACFPEAVCFVIFILFL